jgi:tRNA(fMet)-specific endonuclease VapC
MSLYVLDTDMLTLYRRGHEAVMRHALTHPPEDLAITVITVEEQLSGWYTLLRRVKASADLTRVYDRLVETVMFLSSTHILSFTQPAAAQYEQLRSMRLRIGTMDLRIAAIVLAYGATLVTRNVQDFQRISGLVIEDWTV